MRLTEFLQTKTGFTLYLIITVAAGLLLFEGFARLFFVPVSYDWVERRIQEQELTPKKEKDEFRIFLFGESTMHGHIYYPESSIARWTKLYFEELLPPEKAQKIKVYNFGRLGAVSDFMLDSFRETLAYKPDMVVFYSAHNDFCVGWEWPSVRARRPFGEKFSDFMKEMIRPSVFIGMFRRMSVAGKLERSRQKSKKEYEDKGWFVRIALKQQFDDKDILRKGDAEFKKIKARWEKNIQGMIKTAQKAKVPVVFYKGVSNYKYFEPFKSLNSEELTGEELLKWRNLQLDAQKAYDIGDYVKAIDLFKKALAIDNKYAMTYYRLAQSYERVGEYKLAKSNYFMANEYDVFPIRAPSEVNQFYESLKTKHPTGVYIIDTPEVFEAVSPNSIVDAATIIDAVHPNIYGQSLMAKALVEKISQLGALPFDAEWRWGSVRDWKAMFAKIQWSDERLFESYCELATYVGSYYKHAIEYMEKAVIIKPKSVYARTLLGWLYWNVGEKNKSLHLYSEVYNEGAHIPDGFKEHYSEIYRAIKNNVQR